MSPLGKVLSRSKFSYNFPNDIQIIYLWLDITSKMPCWSFLGYIFESGKEIIDLLLKHGADVCTKCIQMWKTLYSLFKKSNETKCSLFSTSFQINEADGNGETLLQKGGFLRNSNKMNWNFSPNIFIWYPKQFLEDTKRPSNCWLKRGWMWMLWKRNRKWHHCIILHHMNIQLVGMKIGLKTTV